jgi:hypothetical protein
VAVRQAYLLKTHLDDLGSSSNTKKSAPGVVVITSLKSRGCDTTVVLQEDCELSAGGTVCCIRHKPKQLCSQTSFKGFSAWCLCLLICCAGFKQEYPASHSPDSALWIQFITCGSKLCLDLAKFGVWLPALSFVLIQTCIVLWAGGGGVLYRCAS